MLTLGQVGGLLGLSNLRAVVDAHKKGTAHTDVELLICLLMHGNLQFGDLVRWSCVCGFDPCLWTSLDFFKFL